MLGVVVLRLGELRSHADIVCQQNQSFRISIKSSYGPNVFWKPQLECGDTRVVVFGRELTQDTERLVQCKIPEWFVFHSTQFATNTFVFLVLPLFRLEEKATDFPSGENIGKESNALSNVTCFNPVPSVLIIKMLNGNPPV